MTSTPPVPAVDAAALVDPPPPPPTPQVDPNTGAVAQHKRDDKGKPKPPPAPVVRCTLKVPAQPLTAAGLATPYVLGNGCHEADPGQAAFVEATIFDPATNGLAVYRPLVIDEGTMPAVPTVVPVLPAKAVVGIWFGFQGDVLRLVGPGSRGCVNGLRNSLFGQFAYCNAPKFFAAARAATMPPLGTGRDGMPCPTVRDFSVVDQDQSDNVSTVYRVLPNGTTMQATAATLNMGARLVNASDNGLLNRFINPALGCQSAMAADLTDPGAMVPSLALNELSAAAHQGAPIALIPLNDPMTLVKGKPSFPKTRAYRVGVGQSPRIAADSAAAYCTGIMAIAPPRLALDAPFTMGSNSPDPALDLHAFLVQRYQASLTLLGCPA